MKRAIMFGILGAGVAIAVIVGVVFVMPQLMTTVAQTQPQSPGQQQAQQQPVNTNSNNSDAAFTTPEERLRQVDPAFDNFMTRVGGCFKYIPGLTDQGNNPSPNMCRQMMQTAFESWCGAGENFHAEKCKYVTETMETYDIATGMAR